MTANTPTVQNGGLLPSQSEFNMFQVIANNAKKSGLYGGDESKIFMVLLAARELGISPMLALNGGIWNIQGKIEISARLMNAMIRRGGHTMKIVSTSTECTITGKRIDTGEEHTETFTMAMAEKAGLSKSNVWQKYAEDMLYNRCMSRLARRLFPDVIGTAYVEGEVKEAKDIERLEQAECEDLTKTINSPREFPIIRDETIDNVPKQDLTNDPIESQDFGPKIDAVQALKIQEEFMLIDAKCKAAMWTYLKDKFGVDEGKFDDIPESQASVIKSGIQRNIEFNSRAVR